MTHPGHRVPHSTIANGDRARWAALGSARQARIRRTFDGVVASYIRDISERTALAPARDRPRARNASSPAEDAGWRVG
jgi:hypothetical protein